jgi:polar amino acid transport system substrate-binding protein
MRKTLGWFSQLLDCSRFVLLVSATLLVMSGAAFAAGTKQQSSGLASEGLTITPGVLTIGIEIGYPPFEYYDADGKTLLGFDILMAEAMAAKLGLKTRYIDTAWDGIFAGVAVGKYDCIISAVTARSPEETSGLGVAYQGESTSDIYMAKLAAQGVTFTPYEYDKVLNCFDELRLGRVDVIVCDSLVAVDFLTGEDNPFEIVWQGPADETFGICLKKGNDALTQALDKALDELFADGTMRTISQNVFKMDLVSNLLRYAR